MRDPRVEVFVRDLLLPAFTEVARSPRLARDASAHIYDDAIDDAVHATLVAELALDREIGPALLIEEREPARRPAPFGGRYVVTAAMRIDGDAVVVSPVALFQMRFDGELHLFRQRYAALSEVPIEKVTRAMVMSHVWTSFAYYRAHAMSPSRPW